MADDDSISITSTVPSVQKQEYPVEDIIAERDIDGVKKYLVRWEGYPDYRSTWETRSNFHDDTMLDWETQKMRVSRGYAQPVDVEALLNRVEEWIDSTNQRKARRRAKRLRLGLPVNDEEDEYEESEASSSEEEFYLESPVVGKLLKGKGDDQSSRRKQIDPKEKKTSSSRSTACKAKLARDWTEAEEAALQDGLAKVGGPCFDQILEFYGPAGTVSQILKEKTAPELRTKTQKLYEECQNQGIEIPSYLRDAIGAQLTEPVQMHAPGPAPVAVMFPPQMRPVGSGGSKSVSASSNTSPAEISFAEAPASQLKSASSGAKSSPTPSQVDSLFEDDSPETKHAFEHLSSSSPQHALSYPRRASIPNPTSRREVPEDVSSYLPHPVSPAIENPRRGSLPEPSLKSSVIAAKTSGRSHKSIAKDVSETTKSHVGRRGSGPARLGQSTGKPTASKSSKVKVSGAAILNNWNEKVKGRRSKGLQQGTSNKPAKKFSIMRKYVKAGRNEPAPNIDMLTFMDLKSGGVAKKPSLATMKANPPPKTPYQLIQEGLEADTDVLQNTRGTDQLPPRRDPIDDDGQNIAQHLNISQTANRELSGPTTKHDDPIPAFPIESPADPRLTSKKRAVSVSQDRTAEKPIVSRTSLGSKSTDKVELSEATPTSDAPAIPTGPRNERGQPSVGLISNTSASSRDTPAIVAQQAQSSKDKSYPLPHARVQGAPPLANDSSILTQKYWATTAERNLINAKAQHDVIGNILTGPVDNDIGIVRFRGLERLAMKLFLSIKVPPRQMHVRCKHICTVGEYEAFYRGVSVLFSRSVISIKLGFFLTFRQEPTDYIGSGYVVPLWASFEQLCDLAETLKSRASGALVFCERFSMLIYPCDSGLESWDFLNNLYPPIPDGASLRFVLRTPLPPPSPRIFPPSGQEKLLLPSDGESNIGAVFRNLLGIEYGRLIKRPNLEKIADHFFLFFIGVEKEFSLMCRFLAAHGAKIYSWDDEGAWAHFCNHVDTGVILVSFTAYFIMKLCS